MSPWSAIFAAVKPYLGWIAGAVAVLAVLFITYRAGESSARMECAIARAESERQAREWYEAQIAERDAEAAKERQRAEHYRRLLAASRRAAARESEELKHALDKTNLRNCDAGGPWRVLAHERARINRDHAEAIARTLGADGRPGVTAALSGRQTGPVPKSCRASFEYNHVLMHVWDELATRCRSLQALIREREEKP